MPPSSTLLGKLLRLPLSFIPSDLQLPILRGPLRGQKWIAGAASHACWAGTYETARLAAFAQAVFPGAVVYDVGANVGIYTLLGSLRAGSAGKVYAFEPNPRNLAYLRRHVLINRARNCVIREAAVSHSNGSARFSASDRDSSMGRLAAQGDLLVPCLALDSCIYGPEAIPPPHVMKIDVEGAEWDVLQGAARAIAASHPTIFLEIHGTELHSLCRNFLASLGYSLRESYGQITATFPPSLAP